MDVAQAFRAEGFDDGLDAGSDEFGALHLVIFDVNDADTKADFRIEISQHLKLVITAAGEFEHQVIGAKRIQKRDEVAPEAAQHRLTSEIAETDMHRTLVQDA